MMKYRALGICAFLGVSFGGAALAQPGLDIGDATGQAGSTVDVSVDYLGDGSGVVGIQADLAFDNAELSANLDNCGGQLGGANISCSMVGTEIRFAGFDGGLNEIPSGSLGSIAFTIDAGVTAPATFALTVNDEQYSDSGGAPVAPSGTDNGQITVADVQPVPSFSVPDGGTFSIGPLKPGATGQGSIVFTETGGDVGYDVTGCSISGSGAGSFSLVNSSASVPAGGSDSITVSATAPSDGSIPSATLDCTVAGAAYSITLTLFLEPEEVPTLSQWALILLAMGVFGIGFMTLRRRDNTA